MKAWTVGHFSAPAAGYTATADAPKALWPGGVELTRVHNFGAAWSSFSGMRWLLLAVTTAIVAAVAVVLIRRIVRHPLGVAAGALIIAGGLGNIAFRYGYQRYQTTVMYATVVLLILLVCIIQILFDRLARRADKRNR